MRYRRIMMAVAGATLVAGASTLAQNGNPINSHSKNVLTLAVYGDSPYGTTPTDTTETDLTPAFIASINRDPKVDLVIHVGDIHSGKQFCTEAYDRTIYDLWSAFKNPLIYTPGDNEWADCHKSGEGGHVHVNGNPVDYADGDPIANLDLIRSIFFANPGYTLGGRKKQVLFVTLNLPGGSNNDDDNWFGLAKTQAQTDEVSQRSQADLDWLDAAFAQAQHDGAQAVLITTQADMWDRDGKDVSHLANYEPFIASIAAHVSDFGGPVLLFNGDSHHYRSDNPLKKGQTCVFEAAAGTGTVDCNSITESSTFTQDAWNNHPHYNVANFHRVVVHGSTTPLEWLRLTITPGANAPAGSNAFGPFSWERIQP